MNKKMKWIAALVAVSASVSMADISLSFANTLGAYTYTPAGGTITMDFTVDGSGNVSVVNSTTSIDAGFIAAVQAWDGACGTAVGYEGETFQLTFGQIQTYDRVTLALAGSERISLRNINGGAMASGGGNGGRIDWTSGNQEVFHIQQTGGSVEIQLLDFSWDANSTAIPNACDLQFVAGSVNNIFENMTGDRSGTVDVSGQNYIIGGTYGVDDLMIMSPAVGLFGSTVDASHGAGLQGMTLGVIPEPATIGMLGLGAIATLMIRRFRNRA